MALAQSVLGPSKCTSCHDHARQASKWQKEEPAQFGKNAHFNTRKALDDPKSAGYAKAIGIADPYDVKGSCVTCHSTVFRGDANAGVSCESCHGPGSGYLVPHQQKDAYTAAVAKGMRDLRGKPAAIGKMCMNCHVTPDARLAAAGHPTGASFDAGAGLKKLVHWTTTYDYAAVTSAGRTAARGRAPAGGAKAAAAPAGPAAKPPAAGKTTAPAPPAATAPSAAASAGAETKAPAPAEPKAPAAPSTGAPASVADAPWDWDQPIRELPADYVPDAAPGAAPAGAPQAPAPTAEAPAATGPAAAEATSAPIEAQAPAAEAAPAEPPAQPAAPVAEAPAPKARPRRPPPSLVEDSPLPVAAPLVAEQTDVSSAVAPVEAAPPPRTPAAEIAALRGQAAAVLERALRSGARARKAAPASKPLEFAGPDSELLRLQDEVLALAIEALRRP